MPSVDSPDPGGPIRPSHRLLAALAPRADRRAGDVLRYRSMKNMSLRATLAAGRIAADWR